MSEKKSDRYLSAICGSLVGGAVGDALGYPVEFMRWKEIQKEYGPDGIRQYALNEESLAIISDDTQMTLFTANGLLTGDTGNVLNKVNYSPAGYVYEAYRDWYFCQQAMKLPPHNHSWLSDIPETHERRAPGHTCLSALRTGEPGDMEEPINFSKGCGGIMRVAPIALWDQGKRPIEEIDLLGAKAAALTHGHPLGYMPAAALVHLVSRAAFGEPDKEGGLYAIAAECRETMKRLFKADNGFLDDLLRIMEQAEALSRNDKTDVENIHAIGEGWTGEETLGIALYCSLKYQNDFSKAVIAAVNHNGDSDSTGAVAGNIVGAWLGYEAIEEKWLRDLELRHILLEMANDLYVGCPKTADEILQDEKWNSRYGRYCKP